MKRSAKGLHQRLGCSQVAFNMFIPCMLFTKVASTLAAQPDASLLAIPAVAILQARMLFPYPAVLLVCCSE